MNTREAYKDKYEAQLKEWGAKLDGLKARSAKATAQARIDVAPHVNAVQANTRPPRQSSRASRKRPTTSGMT